MAGLVCAGVVFVKLCFPISDTGDVARPDLARPPTPPRATQRAAGPTLNGVGYDKSPHVRRVDLNQPAPPPPHY
jgi:hypothetical protein